MDIRRIESDHVPYVIPRPVLGTDHETAYVVLTGFLGFIAAFNTPERAEAFRARFQMTKYSEEGDFRVLHGSIFPKE